MYLALRKASIQDKEKIWELYKSVIGSPGSAWDSDYPNTEILEDDLEKHFVFVLDDPSGSDCPIAALTVIVEKIEGFEFIKWDKSSEKAVFLTRLCVSPNFQNKGIAKYLLAECLKAMKSDGYETARLLVDKSYEKAKSIYEKLGFIRRDENELFGSVYLAYDAKIRDLQLPK